MKGSEQRLVEYMDGAKKRFVIPVYQRNYDWKQKQCEQLFNDLVQIIKKDRKSHFFGSVVTSMANKGGRSDYLVIDGQQRITTISILFTAMVNLMKSGVVIPEDRKLAEKIEKKFLVDEYQEEERKLRLKPIKDDCTSFDKLITNDPTEFVESSNITQNYHYFENRIKKNEISMIESLIEENREENKEMVILKDRHIIHNKIYGRDYYAPCGTYIYYNPDLLNPKYVIWILDYLL